MGNLQRLRIAQWYNIERIMDPEGHIQSTMVSFEGVHLENLSGFGIMISLMAILAIFCK